VQAVELDVRDADAVARVLGALEPPWSELDILVNNAGLSRGLAPLGEGDLADWREMVETNVMGLLQVTRALLPGMEARGRGHVVNIGSTAGHEVYPGGNVYCATKFAVRALSRGMRLDLAGSPVRVTSVDPGMVETEFSVVRFHGDRERADSVYRGMTPLTPDDVAETVVWCLSRPERVNIEQIVLMPRDQASATLVNRRD
jgi:NADP-dependent 3-hydroxy acid dehydrogenase YdfG